ncbi:MAG: Stp1/IreP family PP2C-type Ser/Thr phosphatase [Solirubrobacteraceae bacterium]
MLRVAEHVARTDTGHQRSTNEDAHLARAPVFVIADGMGGAQAGEVASQLAIAHFADGLPGEDSDGAPERLARAVQEANAEIHALSERDARRAGMGTTLTAAYVGASEISIAHVGDSRAYLLRDGELRRITEDHSLVEELLRQGRLTEEEAEEHPQRSIITRALGPEPEVEVDSVSLSAAAGDVVLICSDGLTSMVPEATVGEILRDAPDITAAADALVAAALDAGGRDNVTVVLFRIEDVPGAGEQEATQEENAAAAVADTPGLSTATESHATAVEHEAAGAATGPALRGGAPAISDAAEPRAPARASRMFHRRAPRMPRSPAGRRRRPRAARVAWRSAAALTVVGVLVLAAVLATQAVYFIGTDSHGQVTVYNGIPYTLPGGLRLYTQYFVSGVTAAELSPLERGRLFNNELRSQNSATSLVSQLELDRIAGQ